MEQPKQQLYMPAEWHDQQMVQLTWPHENTDWSYMLEEVEACYVQLAAAISTREHLLIVAPNVDKVRSLLKKNCVATNNITFFFQKIIHLIILRNLIDTGIQHFQRNRNTIFFGFINHN